MDGWRESCGVESMIPLNTSSDLDQLLEDIGEKRIVMLGEASHGTHEYYTWRTAISKRLIEEKGFQFIAVEGDWPDCYRINRFVKGLDGDDPVKVLKQFDRWPTWMWANWEIAALTEWLYEFNVKKEKKCGFYGLDVYSLWDSMKEIMEYLQVQEPSIAAAAKNAINCFAPYAEDEQQYARFSLTGHSCREQVIDLLKQVRNSTLTIVDDEAAFSAEQNAVIAVNAEKYYSSMMNFDNGSWNVRDRHMMETLNRLLEFHGPHSKAIVWEHNTHIGDARATDMKLAGMINIGQLAREEYGDEDVYLLGFGSYVGSVIAGNAWGAAMREMEVPEARKGSIEERLHIESKGKDGYLLFTDPSMRKKYAGSLAHRAIGVVYDPRREKYGNYVPSVMTERYDAFVFINETSGLHPLHMQPHSVKMPDTYPFGF
jgi:erythromycin esterase-like protein